MKSQLLTHPATVKLGTSRQVVIPKKIHDRLGLTPGDYLQVELTHNKVIFTPKTLVDKQLEEGLSDIRHGRTSGQFSIPQAMVKSLRRATRRKK